jgi:hypothetical protein
MIATEKSGYTPVNGLNIYIYYEVHGALASVDHLQ